MLGRCRPFSSRLQLSFSQFKYRLDRKYFQTSTFHFSDTSRPDPQKPLEDGQHPEQSSNAQNQVLLPLTPPLRAHIASSSNTWTESDSFYLLSRQIRKKGDAGKIQDLFGDKNSPLKNPAGFSALFGRLSRLNELPSLDMILSALKSATEDPEAMHSFLKLDSEFLESVSDESNTKSKKDIKSEEEKRVKAFFRICQGILPADDTINRGHPRDSVEATRRTKMQWCFVITGWHLDEKELPIFSSDRAHCLFNLGPKLQAICWVAYAELLARLGNAHIIEREWHLFQSEKFGPGKQQPDAGAVANYNRVLNVILQSLVKCEDPGRAWQVFYRSGRRFKDLSQKTLAMMLAYSEHIRAWKPGEMNDAALVMLEDEIRKVETHLGLLWEGGEDGFHRIDDGDE